MIFQVENVHLFLFFLQEPEKHFTLDQQIMDAMSGSRTLFPQLCASVTKLEEEWMYYMRADQRARSSLKLLVRILQW